MLHEGNPEASGAVVRGNARTCEDGRVGTVEDDELCHHLRVVNGEEPRHRPAPVVSHQTTPVVSLKTNKNKTEKKTHKICYCPECFLVFFLGLMWFLSHIYDCVLLFLLYWSFRALVFHMDVPKQCI